MRPAWIPKKKNASTDIESMFVTVGYTRHIGVFSGKELSNKDIRRIRIL